MNWIRQEKLLQTFVAPHCCKKKMLSPWLQQWTEGLLAEISSRTSHETLTVFILTSRSWSSRTSTPYWTSPPRPWTPLTTPTGTPSLSTLTPTASTASRLWDNELLQTLTAVPTNSMSSLWNWGRPALTYLLVKLIWPTVAPPCVNMGQYLNRPVLCFSYSNHWPELGQRCLVRQRQRHHQGPADAGCMGLWWQGKHTYWGTHWTQGCICFTCARCRLHL